MKRLIPLLGLLLPFLFPAQAHAVCPVCTVFVGAGIGISRWIGIDDSVTGIWIGGFILSSGLWLADWIRKRNWKIPSPEILSTLLMILFVVPPLYWSHMIGIQGNTLWGMDKIILGTSTGFCLFLISVWIDKVLRRLNHGEVYIFYQKVILPVLILTLASFVFYLITI